MIALPISTVAACATDATMERTPSWSRSAANVSDMRRVV